MGNLELHPQPNNDKEMRELVARRLIRGQPVGCFHCKHLGPSEAYIRWCDKYIRDPYPSQDSSDTAKDCKHFRAGLGSFTEKRPLDINEL